MRYNPRSHSRGFRTIPKRARGPTRSAGQAKTAAWPHDDAPGLAARRIAAESSTACCAAAARSTSCSTRRRELAALAERDRALARALVGDRAAPARHACAICSGLFSNAACRRRRRGSRPRCCSAPRKSCFSTCPIMPRSISRCGWCRPTARRRTLPAWSMRVLRRVAREGNAALAALDTPVLDTPDWLMARWTATYGGETAHAIAAANGHEPALDLTVKSDAGSLGGKARRPRAADRLGAHDRARRGDGAAGLCRRRMVGAGRRRGAAGAPVRRHRRQARRRSLRRARRQDGAARRRRRARHRRRSRAGAAQAACAKISRGCRSPPSSSAPMPRQWSAGAVRRRAARCAVLLDRHHPPPSRRAVAQAARPTSPSSPACSAACSTRAVALTKPGGTLVYCTCSLEPEENEAIVAELLARERGVRRAPIAAAEVFGQRRVHHRGRRPAHAAVPVARCRFAVRRPRRLLCRAAGKSVAISNHYAAVGRSVIVSLWSRPRAVMLRRKQRGASAPMSRVAVANHAKLSWLLLRGAMRQARRPRSTAIRCCAGRCLPLKADRLLIAPQDLRTADATRASEIYSGRFAFAGKVVVCDGRSIFEMEPPSDEWAAALLGFGWLRHLRAAESGITRANARALVDEWIALQGSWHPLAWRPDVLSRRIISWLSQSTLVLQDADVRFYRRFLRSLVRQVRYLRHTAGDARRGVARMQAAIALDLCRAVHRRPGAPHQIRDRAPAARDRAADPARRRPCQPRSRRDHRDPARILAAAAGLHRAQHRAAAGAAQRHRPHDADAALLPPFRRHASRISTAWARRRPICSSRCSPTTRPAARRCPTRPIRPISASKPAAAC